MTQSINMKPATPFAMQFLEIPLDQATGGCGKSRRPAHPKPPTGGGGVFTTEAISAPTVIGGATDNF
jgi:hypothetical protein